MYGMEGELPLPMEWQVGRSATARETNQRSQRSIMSAVDHFLCQHVASLTHRPSHNVFVLTCFISSQMSV